MPGPDLTLIHEPRCNVCRSEHRLAIDGMLLEGKSQAEVLRYWNAQRHSDWLTASSLSRHANRHLDRRPKDISIFDSLPFLDHGRAKLRQREILDAIIDGGAAALYAGIIVPEPSDVLAALTQRDFAALGEMRKEMKWLLTTSHSSSGRPPPCFPSTFRTRSSRSTSGSRASCRDQTQESDSR